MSVIADDPRVRRQGDAFRAAGWDVFAIGLGGGFSIAPDWPIYDIEARISSSAAPSINEHFLERNMYARWAALVASSALGKASPAVFEWLYWRLDRRRIAMLQLALDEYADVWLANDWNTLPVALNIKLNRGTPFGYDTHEFAIEEYAQNWRWRLARRPLVEAIELRGMIEAKSVSCVSQGISEGLASHYRLDQAPVTIRNTPVYEDVATRGFEASPPFEVLYHGILSPGRGLEACITSVDRWRKEFKFSIRGPGDAEYISSLEALARSIGVSDRVRLLPAVPMTELVKEASRADIGLFALTGDSLQNKFALPNKFFEYVMAGLAVCVSDLPEMSRLVREHDLGAIITEASPSAIAKAINSFDVSSIIRHKLAARDAAKLLNWENESRRLIAVHGVTPQGGPDCV